MPAGSLQPHGAARFESAAHTETLSRARPSLQDELLKSARASPMTEHTRARTANALLKQVADNDLLLALQAVKDPLKGFRV